MKQPTALVVVAWIFIIEGIAALVPALRSMIVEHQINLNFSLLGLWIGPGLLRRSESHRGWALFTLHSGVLLGAIALLFVVVWSDRPPITVFHRSLGFLTRGYLAATVGLFLIGTIWQLRVLERPDVRRLFDNPLKELPPRG